MKRDSLPDIPIGPILESLGARLPHHRGGWRKMRCFNHEDRHPSATVNFDINRFHCFSCGISEDSIGLLMLDGTGYVAALAEAMSIAGVTERPPTSWKDLF